jgi:hypothetical protein
MRREPYSVIIKCLAERMSLGQTTTAQDLLKIGILLPKNKKNNFDRKIEEPYLSRVVSRLVKNGVLVRSGRFIELANRKKMELTWDVDRLIFQSELLKVVRSDVNVAFPEEWDSSLTEPILNSVKEQIGILNKTWARVVLAEIEKRVRAEIIDVDVKRMNQSEKALGLWMFNRAMEGHLLQLGWVIADSCGSNIEIKMNTTFLEDIGILSTMQKMYSNDSVDIVKNNTLRIAIARLIKEIKRREKGGVTGPLKRKAKLKEIGTDRREEISQKVETILRPLQKLNEPLIIARVTLPLYETNISS